VHRQGAIRWLPRGGGTPGGRAAPALRSGATTIDEDTFATAGELRRLTRKLVGFGLRNPGSRAHNGALGWLERELRTIPGMEVRSDEYPIARWQPLPAAPGRTPGRDPALAGALQVELGGRRQAVPVAGAVPFSLPTGEGGCPGELVHVPAGEPVTASAARGRVVVRDVVPAAIPYALFHAIGHHMTADLPRTGDYDRAYLRRLDPSLVEAGLAGAAGLVFLWDVPTDQLRAYWGPHTGTRYHVPAVHVGNDQADELRQWAAEGRRARVTVQARWDRARTRNLVATLRGRSRERIVLNTHTDGNTWVQENGPAALLALARSFAALPLRARERDVELALTSAHLGFTSDGTFRHGAQLDEDFDRGTVAFVLGIEHLGTREILPRSPGGRLELTGSGEVMAWSAPEESPVLVAAAVDAVQRRRLDRTAVLQGVGAPDPDQVPRICSQGGLGSNFHARLIPTTSIISGPWSLFAPSFGQEAVDFERMRRQVLALGDVARALDGVPRAEIAGAYLAEREQRSGGARACEPFRPPAVAPVPEG
jgi:hypothetical protein